MDQKDVAEQARDERREVHRDVEEGKGEAPRVRRGAPLDPDGEHGHSQSPADGGGDEEAEQGRPFRAGQGQGCAGGARGRGGEEQAAAHSDGVDDGAAEDPVQHD